MALITKNDRRIENLKKDIESKNADLKKFDFTSIYKDSSLEKSLKKALVVENTLFTHSENGLPEEVFTSKGTFELKEKKGSIFQYQKQGTPE